MLFKTTVTSWLGIGRDKHVIIKQTGTQYVFDINNVSNIQPEGTGSKFRYLVSTVNRKTGYDEIHCTASVADVKGEYGVAPLSNILELSVFPNNDVTKTPFTTRIDIHDFGYAWPHNPYPQYTWLVYSAKGSKEVRVLVDMTLEDLLQLDTPFDETNIQWYSFVDPLEEIHPTWYIRVEPITAVIYGKLYNWYAVNDAKHIANTGWHVPNNTEFDTLIAYLGGQANAGGKLKEIGNTYWDDPNVGATNEVGFNGRGGGFRSILGWQANIRQALAMWSSNELNVINAHWAAILNFLASMQAATGSATDKNFGLSLRLIKDFTSLSHSETSTYQGNDGKVYRTICIGTQEWMADNLMETKYRDGTAIPEVTDDVVWNALATGAVCTYNNDWTYA